MCTVLVGAAPTVRIARQVWTVASTIAFVVAMYVAALGFGASLDEHRHAVGLP